MKRCDAGSGKSFAVGSARPVGWMRQFSRATRSRPWTRDPAGGIRRAEARIVVKGLNLPDAGVLHVGELVNALGPGGGSAEAAEHGKDAPPCFGGLAAGIQMNHRLQDHVVVEPAIGQPDFPSADVLDQMFPDARPADKDSVGVIRHGVGGKQIGHVVPHPLVDVVAVGPLELLNGAYVLAARYFGLELIQPLLQSRNCWPQSRMPRTRFRSAKAASSDEHQEQRVERVHGAWRGLAPVADPFGVTRPVSRYIVDGPIGKRRLRRRRQNPRHGNLSHCTGCYGHEGPAIYPAML